MPCNIRGKKGILIFSIFFPAHSRVDRGNIILRHYVPQFPPNFRHYVLSPERWNKILINTSSFPPNGNHTRSRRVYVHKLVLLRYDDLKTKVFIKFSHFTSLQTNESWIYFFTFIRRYIFNRLRSAHFLLCIAKMKMDFNIVFPYFVRFLKVTKLCFTFFAYI